MVADALFSSTTDEWATPDEWFRLEIQAEFGIFDLDPCATAENAKAARFHTRLDNGIRRPWFGKVWINPPYGRSEDVCKSTCAKKRCVKRGWHRTEYYHGAEEWVERAVLTTRQIQGPKLVVMLLPVRTDTEWWQDWVIPYASEVRFIRGRLTFGGAKNTAPFPSAVVIFRNAYATVSPT